MANTYDKWYIIFGPKKIYNKKYYYCDQKIVSFCISMDEYAAKLATIAI